MANDRIFLECEKCGHSRLFATQEPPTVDLPLAGHTTPEISSGPPELPARQRFWLFAGDKYYPLGGIHDFVGDFDNKDDAIRAVTGRDIDWWHIVDTQNRKIVAEGK